MMYTEAMVEEDLLSHEDLAVEQLIIRAIHLKIEDPEAKSRTYSVECKVNGHSERTPNCGDSEPIWNCSLHFEFTDEVQDIFEVNVFNSEDVVVGNLRASLKTMKSGNQSRWHVLGNTLKQGSVGLIYLEVSFKDSEEKQAALAATSLDSGLDHQSHHLSLTNISHACKEDFVIPAGSTLRLKIVKGQNLVRFSRNSSGKAFVIVKAGNNKVRTREVGWKEGQDPSNPIWDQVLHLTLPENFSTQDPIRFKVGISGAIVANIDMNTHEGLRSLGNALDIVDHDSAIDLTLNSARSTSNPRRSMDVSGGVRGMNRRCSLGSVPSRLAEPKPRTSSQISLPTGSCASTIRTVWIPLVFSKHPLRMLPPGSSYAENPCLCVEFELIPSERIQALCGQSDLDMAETDSVENYAAEEEHVPPMELPPPLQTELIDMEVPMSVQQLEDTLLNPESEFVKLYCSAMGYKDVKLTPWKEVSHPETGEMVKERLFTYLMPASRFVRANNVNEVQRILKHEAGGLVLEIATSTPDVPFGNCFFTDLQYVLQHVSANTSRLLITCEARFVKNTYMRAMIVKTMTSGLHETYAVYTRQLEIITARQSQIRQSENKPEDINKAAEHGETKAEKKLPKHGVRKSSSVDAAPAVEAPKLEGASPVQASVTVSQLQMNFNLWICLVLIMVLVGAQVVLKMMEYTASGRIELELHHVFLEMRDQRQTLLDLAAAVRQVTQNQQ
eukprot:Colp12_sorted_trinity150504_noHs@23483